MDTASTSDQTYTHKMPLDRRKSLSTSGETDQGETCRICRGEGTADQPLFYPCKCSGSIKFVHQDCLMEWLSHSQKKYCELCKTPFKFTKLYDKSMPATLPTPLFLRQVGVHTFRTLGRWLRYIFVTFIWTCWLPWSIRQIWRGLFWLADGSWMTVNELKQLSTVDLPASAIVNETAINTTSVSNTTLPSYFDPVGELFNLLTGAPLLRGLLRLLTSKPVTLNVTVPGTNDTFNGSGSVSSLVRQPSLLSNVSSLNSLTNYHLVNNGLIDILEGQLICLSVIAAFILVFLIREWVINQQPILNMPNPDQANAQPAPAPPNEEARQLGRRRRRGFRRFPDRDGQADNRIVDVAQRPIATPRPRRAVTDEHTVTTQPTEQALERPYVPPRSSSLISGSASTDSIFSMDIDDDASWHPDNQDTMENLESPPLQRGMFDDVVHIRRNIEERVLPLPDHIEGDLSDQVTPFLRRRETDPSTASMSPQHELDANQVQRTDFVFGQQPQAIETSPVVNGSFTFSSPFGTQAPTDATDPILPPGSTITEDSDSPWEALDLQPTNENALAVDEVGQDLDIEDEPLLQQVNVADVIEVPVSTAPEPPTLDVDQVPTSVLDSLAQWMWHTDERIRVRDNVAEQGEPEPANNAHDRGHLLAAPNANPRPQPANLPAHEPNIQFGVDLNDPNALDDAEDLEGILELIGMEGPLAGMIQNIIFSVFLITLTLSASVWCPYIWGKIAILIMSNPIGVFFKAPLYLISKCGNFLIDLLLFITGLVGYGLSNFAKVLRMIVAPILPGLAAHIKVAAVEGWAYGVSQHSGMRLERALSGTIIGLRPDLPTFSMQSHHALRVFRRAFYEAFSAILADLVDTLKNAASWWQSHGLLGLPIFVYKELVAFPGACYSAAQQVLKWWHVLCEDLKMRPFSQMPEHDFSSMEWTTEDKISAIVVGYAFFAAAGFAYLKIAHALLGLKKGEKVDGIFADSLRQAGGVLKVIIIIGIEMIAFPLYCGLLLDCALLPLFHGATFQSRLDFLMNAPVTCLFIHWFVGTCYMFHFALFVSMCRRIMRKGVLYFIRDPDDPTFHPVRDVLERPVATQLGKIAFSALVYGGLVIVCLGGVVWTISSIRGILPIHWATNEPRLAFPVDIVFYNFMLPFLIRRAEPNKKITVMCEWWFRQCARVLRLSHFLFGEEQEDEKFETQPFWQIYLERQGNKSTTASDNLGEPSTTSKNHHFDGRYVRAPAADSVRIPKGTKVFVDVNENNERIDGVADNDTGMHGKKDDRFVRIYIPPHFRSRVSIFIFLVWLFVASTGVAFTVLPLLVGRYLIHIAASSTSAPNDLYAFTVGVHACGGIVFATYIVASRQNRIRSKASEVFHNTKESLPRLYQLVRHFLGLLYLFTTVFVILPCAASLLTELYIHMPIYSYFANTVPIRHAKPVTSSPSSAPVNPTIFLLQTWTLGLLYLRLALRLAISYPNGQNRPSTAIRAITRNGYLHPDVRLASRALVLPALTCCIVLLAAPLGLARMLIVATGTKTPEEKLRFYRNSYPVLLGMAVTAYVAVGIQHKIEGWRVKIRDEVYLVGERLHNFADSDGDKKKGKQDVVALEKGKGRAVDHDDRSLDTEQGLNPQQGTAQVIGHQFEDSEKAVASGSSFA